MVFVFLSAMFLGGLGFYHVFVAPNEKQLVVTITDGSSLGKAAHLLKQAGAIRSEEAFLWLVHSKNKFTLKAGDYQIEPRTSLNHLVTLLEHGPNIRHIFIVPEGMASLEVHDRLMAEPSLVGDIPVPAEGSLLPDGYAFVPGEKRALVVARMEAAMTKMLHQLWIKKAPDIGVKIPEQAVILASIVEKETALPEERPIVAGVYYNRLQKNMRLQADPTIIYPITHGYPLGHPILRSELMAQNSYNTYQIKGLPSGPITNPSRSSLMAVLHPAKTEALYFVANGKGGHIFSNNLEEQSQHVRDYHNRQQQKTSS
ncbi:aminodeoxychorismate lyase [Zymomonas mobilis subsp. pomaceae ATCC 29192]|uniref:Endolytic murein transglycosylase n=1 Tax=Zymomonas mobilis subsp. pomaceae (strain ATCC 29192 / DSM 22645 / JCM 10191 / CCUG 17912 / NBRC 13757 / NCIMB 11200 / NRRL B-4491 / Barker I) TaxID=579138 RepID=F8ET63_ZYMMT|nr:aminodeoxychorismate lyase [Zymomonas mobilis subsp. pomaceae ATCC 29192]